MQDQICNSPLLPPRRRLLQDGTSEMHYFCERPEQQWEKANLWAKDQRGSRHVQHLLENSAPQIKEIIFRSLLLDAASIIRHHFGNYVFQKVFDYGQFAHKEALFSVILDDIISLSQHDYGCRIVQKAIQFSRQCAQRRKVIMKLLRPSFSKLIFDINGNHVVQKCCEAFPKEQLTPIANVLLEEVQLNIIQLSGFALHPYSCRVLQKYLLHSNPSQQREQIVRRILGQAVAFSQCQYGNYVIQDLLKEKNFQLELFKAIQGSLSDLSCSKYASNVIERTIRNGSEEVINLIAGKIISEVQQPSAHRRLIDLATNQFGNYVVQSLLEKASQAKKKQLVQKLEKHHGRLGQSQYGKHVLALVEACRRS